MSVMQAEAGEDDELQALSALSTRSLRRVAPMLEPFGVGPAGVRLVDLGLTAGVGFIQVVGTFGASRGQPEAEDVDALAIALLLVGPLALLFRRRWPVGVLGGVLSSVLAYMLLGYPFGPVFLSPIIAVFTAVIGGHRIAGWVGMGALYGVHMVARQIWGDAPSVIELFGVAAWLLLILVASEAVRAYRERATARTLTAEEEARRRASEERLRIARELHDVLAHHISLINVQASVALHLMDRTPEQARTSLVAIEGASREAMAEVRSVLDILRHSDEGDLAPRAPTPSLDQLDVLVQRAEAAGLAVTLDVEGDPRPLGAPVEAAAYRVIQEAVTNVIRHAGATSASIRMTCASDRLTVEVTDDGRGRNAPDVRQNGGRESRERGSGSGIAGMRDRVTALGGELQAGPRAGGGFRVRAWLPLAVSSIEERA